MDGHVFTGPNPGSLAEFLEFSLPILPLHTSHPMLGVAPGMPHDPPYDTEMGDGLRREGYVDRNVFDASEFSEGRAVWLTYMAVACDGAPTGSAPDLDDGPIIEAEILPIVYSGRILRNGEIFDANVSSEGPVAPSALDPPLDGEGYSHIPFWSASAVEFGPPDTLPAGEYEHNVTRVDATGAGWRIVTRWTVE